MSLENLQTGIFFASCNITLEATSNQQQFDRMYQIAAASKHHF